MRRLSTKNPAFTQSPASLASRSPITASPSPMSTTWKVWLGGVHRNAAVESGRVEPVDQERQIQVGEAVRVVGEEDLLLVDVLAHRRQALADVRAHPGVDEGDPPVLDVRVEQLEVAAAARQDEVVGDPFLVVEEVVLDDVALVAEAEDEVRVPVVGVVLHEVPQHRAGADRDHRLRDLVGVVAHPQPLAAAEQHDLQTRRGAHSTTSSVGMWTTNRPPQSRTYEAVSMISSRRFTGRIRT